MTIEPFKDAQFEKNPSGAIIMDGVEVAHTLQCCHCSAHFVSVRGSGKRRGFCLKCRKVTCGKAACDVCIPYEAKLDLSDGGNVSEAARRKLLSAYSRELDQLGFFDSHGNSLI